MADFSSYLEKSMDDVPKSLPSLPAGHFFAVISDWKTGERKYDKTNPKNITPVVELTFKITGPDDDVDTSQLPEGGGIGRIVTKDYTLNDAEQRGQISLRRIAEVACELDVKGQALADVLDALKGQDVRVHNAPKAGKEEGQFYNNVDMVLSAS